ncbi:MAG: hypothetical protein AABM67_11180 [Acidobacteriota bacterium]
MKIYAFSFKNEAIWSMIFSLIGLAVGGVVLLVTYLLHLLS